MSFAGMRRRPTRFYSLQLDKRRADSWAVIESPSGAVALDGTGALIMRLPKETADQLAARMTVALKALPNEPASGALSFRDLLVEHGRGDDPDRAQEAAAEPRLQRRRSRTAPALH